MMKEETARKIEELRKKVGNGLFFPADCVGIISISTLAKYNLIENAEEVVEKREYSLDELIEEINEMIGEDCYDMEGSFVNENGRIFYVRKAYGYKFKA